MSNASKLTALELRSKWAAVAKVIAKQKTVLGVKEMSREIGNAAPSITGNYYNVYSVREGDSCCETFITRLFFKKKKEFCLSW